MYYTLESRVSYAVTLEVRDPPRSKIQDECHTLSDTVSDTKPDHKGVCHTECRTEWHAHRRMAKG